MKTKLKIKGDTIKLIAGSKYSQPGNTLAKVTDTGNGFVCKFPAWTCIQQDNYVCLSYAEAAYLFKILKNFEFMETDDE